MKTQDAQPTIHGREKVVRNVLITLVMVLFVVPMLVPMYWLVLTALRPNSTTNTLPLNLLPTNLTLENVVRQLSDAEGFLTYFRNSLITASASMILTIMVSVLAGYALSRLRFPQKAVHPRLLVDEVRVEPLVRDRSLEAQHCPVLCLVEVASDAHAQGHDRALPATVVRATLSAAVASSKHRGEAGQP